jgi:hypothetical protein
MATTLMRPAAHNRSEGREPRRDPAQVPPQPRHRDISLLFARTIRCQPKVVATSTCIPGPEPIPAREDSKPTLDGRGPVDGDRMQDHVCHAEERVPDPKPSRCRRRWRSRNYANAGLGTVSSALTGPSHGLPPSSAGCDRDEASSGRPDQRLHPLPAAVGNAAREWR